MLVTTYQLPKKDNALNQFQLINFIHFKNKTYQ
jgi:hypothetical protein